MNKEQIKAIGTLAVRWAQLGLVFATTFARSTPTRSQGPWRRCLPSARPSSPGGATTT